MNPMDALGAYCKEREKLRECLDGAAARIGGDGPGSDVVRQALLATFLDAEERRFERLRARAEDAARRYLETISRGKAE